MWTTIHIGVSSSVSDVGCISATATQAMQTAARTTAAIVVDVLSIGRVVGFAVMDIPRFGSGPGNVCWGFIR
jgi:hypothetical protein